MSLAFWFIMSAKASPGPGHMLCNGRRCVVVGFQHQGIQKIPQPVLFPSRLFNCTSGMDAA